MANIGRRARELVLIHAIFFSQPGIECGAYAKFPPRVLLVYDVDDFISYSDPRSADHG